VRPLAAFDDAAIWRYHNHQMEKTMTKMTTKGAIRAKTTAAPSVFETMSNLLGTPLGSDADTLRLVRHGVPVRAYKSLQKRMGVPISLLGAETTLRRRVKEQKMFSPRESERMVRLARVFAQSVDLFGSEERARKWLNTPTTWAPDEAPTTPLELIADSESGARLIEGKILRTLHGMF
jgi:putative toxin-antitoxin system antitoxin component (TIGR02293 family)